MWKKSSSSASDHYVARRSNEVHWVITMVEGLVVLVLALTPRLVPGSAFHLTTPGFCPRDSYHQVGLSSQRRRKRLQSSVCVFAASSSSSSSSADGEGGGIGKASSSSSPSSSFDFASPSEWDAFYQSDDGSEADVTEWHSSIDLEDIAMLIPYNSLDATRILMIGCGNSELPEVVLSEYYDRRKATDSQAPPPEITLLDTSPTCIEQLQLKYGSQFEYKSGDASNLAELWSSDKDDDDDDDDDDETGGGMFDIIIDKGLTDAILCSEGWDGALRRVLEGAAEVLKPNSGPTSYLLISYKLPQSTQDFITDVGMNQVGLDWEFDLADISNDRVSVSIATRVQRS